VNAPDILPLAAGEIAAGVPEREYRRLLGLPRNRELTGDLAGGAQHARRWYAVHGRPFVAVRRVEVREVGPASVTLATGDVLTSVDLADRLRAGEAHALVALAASAGLEVANEAARLWAAGRPDEAYFLDRLAAAITEGLVSQASVRLCRTYAPRHERLLPHLSPGCSDWDLADQQRLMRLLTGQVQRPGAAAAAESCGPVTVLASGALHPQHSLLAALGVTRRAVVATRESSCRRCDLDPCGFRRVPCAR